MTQPIRAGILGTGFMGQQHGKRLSQMTGVEISAICDTQPQGAKSLKDSLACNAALYSDFDQMLAKTPLDVLYVCIPPFAHDGQVEKAAGKGIHVFLEKPIALTVPAAQRMVDAIEKAGVVSQVGFHFRFRKSVRRIKELIASGAAGKPTQFIGRYWCNMLGNAWWRDINGSGGQVLEQVIHIYDMAAYVLGSPLETTAFMDNLCHRAVGDYSIEDTSTATIRFTNGALATIAGSNCAIPDHFIGDFRVVCEKAVLDLRSTGDWRDKDLATVFTHDGKTVAKEEFIEDGDPYGDEDIDFIEAVRRKGATVTPARHGLDALKLVHAVIASAKNGGAVQKIK